MISKVLILKLTATFSQYRLIIVHKSKVINYIHINITLHVQSFSLDLGHTFGIIKCPTDVDPICFVDADDIELDANTYEPIMDSTTILNRRFSDQMLWLAHMESTTTAVRKVETKYEKEKFLHEFTNYSHRGLYGLDFDLMAENWNTEVLEQEKINIPRGMLSYNIKKHSIIIRLISFF